MTTLDPPIKAGPIDDVLPGSMVQVGAACGFCAVNRSSPQQNRVMVMYDTERASFQYRYTPVGVLNVGADMVIVPSLKSLVEIVPAAEATSELLLIGDSPKIQFHVEDGGGSRQLDLKKSVIEPLSRALVAAFREWTVGVNNTAVDGFLPLLDIGPRLGAAFDDDVPIEPDKV
jgi:hypothetical protein